MLVVLPARRIRTTLAKAFWLTTNANAGMCSAASCLAFFVSIACTTRSLLCFLAMASTTHNLYVPCRVGYAHYWVYWFSKRPAHASRCVVCVSRSLVRHGTGGVLRCLGPCDRMRIDCGMKKACTSCLWVSVWLVSQCVIHFFLVVRSVWGRLQRQHMRTRLQISTALHRVPTRKRGTFWHIFRVALHARLALTGFHSQLWCYQSVRFSFLRCVASTQHDFYHASVDMAWR